MINTEKMFEQIEKIDTERYKLQYDELIALHERYPDEPFTMALDAYRLGFIKGQRALKAELKKKVGVC